MRVLVERDSSGSAALVVKAEWVSAAPAAAARSAWRSSLGRGFGREASAVGVPDVTGEDLQDAG
nr:hypothetical protein GCM10020092_059560 [Actinoplanes digitatis]